MKKQSGFTLVEIAIVMVIIGLLLGGVMKGQEMMVNARVKNLAADFNNMPAAYYSYVDRFRAVPGDDAAVTTHLTGATPCSTTATLGDGTINGEWTKTTAEFESALVWQHLRLANLMTGTTTLATTGYLPVNAVNGSVGMSGTTPISTQPGQLFICSGGIDGAMVNRLDVMFDDGIGNTGNAWAATTAAPTAAVASPAAGTNYNICIRQ